jgi:hypothetical protein
MGFAALYPSYTLLPVDNEKLQLNGVSEVTRLVATGNALGIGKIGDLKKQKNKNHRSADTGIEVVTIVSTRLHPSGL